MPGGLVVPSCAAGLGGPFSESHHMSTILFSQSLKKPNLSLLVALALGASVGCTRTHRGAEPSSDMNQSSPVSAEADFWSPSGDAAASSSKSVAAPQSVAPKDRAEGEMADDGMAYRGAPAPGKMSEKKAKGDSKQQLRARMMKRARQTKSGPDAKKSKIN